MTRIWLYFCIIIFITLCSVYCTSLLDFPEQPLNGRNNFKFACKLIRWFLKPEKKFTIYSMDKIKDIQNKITINNCLGIWLSFKNIQHIWNTGLKINGWCLLKYHWWLIWFWIKHENYMRAWNVILTLDGICVQASWRVICWNVIMIIKY